MTDDAHDGDADPAEAFALIGNEIRANILRVLGEDPHAGISFSELRSRVDEGIDSGQFNYHLDKLVGQFVRDGEDGYELRPEGLTLYRAIRAGSFNRRVTRDPFPAGFDCYFCETGVEASYDDGTFVLQCPDCDHEYTHTMVPPSAAEDADQEALLDHVGRYNRHEILAYARGVCPNCVSPVERGFVCGEEVWTEGADHFEVWVHHRCDHCGQQHYTSVGLALLFEPSVISFFHDHGVDVTRHSHWEFEALMTDHHTTVRSTDPWEVTLEITHEGETLELTVDDDLTILDVARESQSAD